MDNEHRPLGEHPIQKPTPKPYCGHINMKGCPLYITCDECDKQPYKKED